jgi:mycothiol synthase
VRTAAQLALRPPIEADVPAIAAVCNAITRKLFGTGDADEQEVRKWFAMSDLGVFVAERNGQIVGYADVRDDDKNRFPIDLRALHGEGRQDVATTLLEAAEEWARARAVQGATVRAFVPERDRDMTAVLERAGYTGIRHSFEMLIEPLDRLEAARWPAGFTVRTYEPMRDEQKVYECVEEAFADHWDFRSTPLERWRTQAFGRPDFDPSLWWLAEADGELAGVCLNAWHLSGDRTFGWVETLGVRRPWRRCGLALALLLHSFADFKRRGARRVALSVDAQNTTGAVGLYERAGMSVDRRNDTYEKAL